MGFSMDSKIDAKELTFIAEGNYEFGIQSLHLHAQEDGVERLLINVTTDDADGECPVLSLTVTDEEYPARAEGGMKVLQSLITQTGVDSAGQLKGCSFDGYIKQNVNEETGEVFTNIGVQKGKPVTVVAE